jgi:hypothetical protein
LKSTVQAAIEAFPDDVRAEFVQPRFALRFLSAIEAGLARCDRTAMMIYASSMKLLGEEHNLALQIVTVIGAQAGEARTAVESQRNVAALAQDRPAMAAKLARWLLEYSAESGEPLSAIMARASGAEVVESHAENGNGVPLL